jgi:hypothetical protein
VLLVICNLSTIRILYDMYNIHSMLQICIDC